MGEPVDSTDSSGNDEFALNIQESIAILDRLWALGPNIVNDVWIDFDEAGSSYRTALMRNGCKLVFMLEDFPKLNDPEFSRSITIQIEWNDPNESQVNYMALLNNMIGNDDNRRVDMVAKSLKLIEQMLLRRPNNAA